MDDDKYLSMNDSKMLADVLFFYFVNVQTFVSDCSVQLV